MKSWRLRCNANIYFGKQFSCTWLNLVAAWEEKCMLKRQAQIHEVLMGLGPVLLKTKQNKSIVGLKTEDTCTTLKKQHVTKIDASSHYLNQTEQQKFPHSRNLIEVKINNQVSHVG